MRCILVTGTLGSGKTTLITAILSENAKAGLPKPVLIVNDVGRFNVDRSRLAGTGATEDILDMTSGCLDCADREAFVRAVRETVARGHDLLVEPTGAANGDNLKEVFDECGLKPLVVTLLSAAHFRRNRAYDPKAMESQTRHAALIGLTWCAEANVADLGDPGAEEVLRYVGHHAPSARVFLVPKDGVPDELLRTILHSSADATTPHVCSHGCSHHHHHGHVHGHHDHLHAHVRTVGLRPGIRTEDLRSLCDALQDSHGLARAKGAFIEDSALRRFDFVHGDFNVAASDEAECSANFISTQAIPEYLFTEIAGAGLADAKPSVADAIEAIEYGLSNAWGPTMENGDVREDNAFLYRAYHRSIEYGVPAELRERAILAYADWYLLVAEALRGRDWHGHPKLPQWQRRIGVHLSLLAAMHPEILGTERVRRIAGLRTAHLAFDGLLAFRAEDLSFKADPVETPDDLRRVAEFGIVHEGLTTDTIERAFAHCASLSDDPEWTEKWHGAAVS
jgi:G3E family GTPase